jgi:class 3 adenylate cyclase
MPDMGGGPPTSLLACAACGVALTTGAKFCSECGTPVTATADRETRRTVTLLFTDVAGSTALGERLDPETYRAVMGHYFAVAREAIERHGGTVEKFVGDAVLAVFGIPAAREDDALRAVRAAHELNLGVTEQSERLLADHGVRFAIRTGVNTGPVVAGGARAGGSFATGDAVNTAARLEQAAAPGEILLGGTTYALVRDAVEAEAVEPVRAKGKSEPVPAYRLIGVLDAERGRRRREDAALIGRTSENAALDDAFEQTITAGCTRLVTVLGPPGIGKSRLASEFLTRVGTRATLARGRCLSYGQGITYWPLVQALRDALDLSGTESAELTRHALREAIGRAGDRDEIVEPLLALLGKAGIPGGGEQISWAVRRLLEEMASQRPLVLCIDDLHWAEPNLLGLLERVREQISDRPLLLLCQARPEVLDAYPEWVSEAADSTLIRLEPLSLEETTASVAALLGGVPPEGLAGMVATWSGGNPLFIEEIVTHLVESGACERAPGGTWRSVGPLDRAEAPPTVAALLASRLDRLPAAERDLLERVSVIGLEFDTTQAEVLVEPGSRPALADLMTELAARDLVRTVGPGESATWAFKHVLVRDAAYDGMAKALRSELHERFADAIAADDEGDDGGDERVGFVAHHLEQAARYRRELAGRDPEAEALVDRAVESLVRAADHARDREREDTSASYLGRALELGPSTPGARRDVLARRVVSCFEAGLLDLLSEALKDYEAELGDLPEGVEHAFLRTMRGVHELSTGGAVDAARVSASAEKLIGLGRATGDVVWVVRGLRALAMCSAVRGLWRDADAVSEEILSIGSQADAREAQGLHLAALLLGDGSLREWREEVRQQSAIAGQPEVQRLYAQLADAVVAAADCSDEAEGIIATTAARGDELHAAGALNEPTLPLLVDAYEMRRDADGAIAYLRRTNDGFRRTGHLGHASTYILAQALLMLERGDAATTVLPLVEEAAVYTSPYDGLSVACLSACRAIVASLSGDLERSADLAAEALRVADSTHEVWHRADLRRYLSVVPRATGDHALERRLLLEADEMYRRKGIRSYEAEIAARLSELDGGES